MKGLLLKDLSIMKTQGRSALIIMLIALFMLIAGNNTAFAVVYANILFVTFGITTISYDNYDNGYGEYLKSDWLLKTPDGTYGIYIIDEYGESIISNSLSAIQGICPVLTITITE